MTSRRLANCVQRGCLLGLLASVFALSMLAKGARAEQIFGAEPGTRSSSHRWIPRCDQCHVSQHVLSDAKCLSCHEPIQKRISWGHGLHSYGYKQGLTCFRCHREHRGDSSDVSGWAAIGGMDFDHAITDFPLRGKHASAPSQPDSGKTCHRCHSRAPQHFDPPSPLCGNSGCHKRDDAHFGTLGQRCNRCHLDGSSFKRPVFDHNDPNEPDRWALVGEHLKVECASCHPKPKDGGTPAFKATSKNCDGCHKDPHRGRYKRHACSECHTPIGWQDGVSS